MGRDDSWPAPSLVWCRLVTVSTDPFTTFSSPTGPFLSEWAKCQPGNIQNGGTIANLMADSESGSPISYSSFLVIICLSRLVSEIFACDRQTDNANHCYSWPRHCGGPVNNDRENNGAVNLPRCSTALFSVLSLSLHRSQSVCVYDVRKRSTYSTTLLVAVNIDEVAVEASSVRQTWTPPAQAARRRHIRTTQPLCVTLSGCCQSQLAATTTSTNTNTRNRPSRSRCYGELDSHPNCLLKARTTRTR